MVIVNLFLQLCSEKSNNLKESEVVLKSYLKSVYNLPRGNDSIYYLLVEVKIINNSNSKIEFLTMSCSTGENLVFDSGNVNDCINNCSGNSLAPITLNPKQEFSVLSILKTTKDIPKYLKIGWVLVNDKDIGSLRDFFNILEESKGKLENIIWGAPLELTYAGVCPFEVNN